MTRFGVLCILYCLAHVHASRKFFFGHMVEYGIPPPAGPVKRDDAVTTEYFSQNLDHYDPTNKNLWLQRYQINTSPFDPTKSPVVFLMIGGEGVASEKWMTSGAWYDSAKKFGALMFQLEHRFYGKSQPFEDLSTENLRYLTSYQALADLATFIPAMNKKYNFKRNVKWIVFGGSYPGSLAAWLRQKYPHLVQGAMSASGPLFAQLDFPEYLQVVVDDLATHSQACVENLKTAISGLEQLIQTPGDENVTKLFNLCDDINSETSEKDLANFFQLMADNFAGVAQYNKISGQSTTVDDLCDILVDTSLGKPVNRLAAINKLFSDNECNDFKYDTFVNTLKDTTITERGNMRQWIYQTCTEFGWYQTTSQREQIFGSRFPVEYFTKQCEDIYGAEFNQTYTREKIEKINILNGGLDIEATNVVYVHGSFDPWHPLGITRTKSLAAPAIFINGSAHCANMYTSSEDDLDELAAAREEVDRLIGVWLQSPSTSGAGSNFSLHIIILVISASAGISLNLF